MAWVLAVSLAVVLLVVIVSSHRREQQHLRKVSRTLKTLGDSRQDPRSIGDALDRLANLIHSDTSDEMPRRVQAAFDALSSAAVLVDNDGVELIRNSIASKYQGGRHGDALVESQIQAQIAKALLGQASQHELQLHGPPPRQMMIIAEPVISKGELLGAVALVDDISEQQRLDQVRRDFIANVSHELRTPVGALSLLAESIEGETNPDVLSSFLARIQDEAFRLSRLIDDLLDLSKIEGGIDRSTETVELAAVLEEGLASVRPAADQADAEITLVLFDSPSIEGDRSQLLSAVTNLLNNAIKYGGEGAKISVRLVSHGAEVAIVVEDDGIGIPPRDINRVFERFYRVDRGRATKTGGTGLGLSIVRNVAVNHGGRVELASQEGVGSTFSIVLPVEAVDVNADLPEVVLGDVDE